MNWERAIFKGNRILLATRAKLFYATDTCQTLSNVVHGAHQVLRRRSWYFSTAMCTVKRPWLEIAAIDRQVGPKAVNNGALAI